MTEFIAKSGARITINPAPWKVAKELKRAIEAEASTITLPTDLSASNLTPLFGAMLKVDSSPAVESALWPCLLRCTRNDVKITEDTFDDVEARKDYYEIITACVKENYGPFVADLYFLLSAMGMNPAKTEPQHEGAPASQ